MKRTGRLLFALCLTAALAFCALGAQADGTKGTLPDVGERMNGFVTTAAGEIPSAGAETRTLTHEVSGATLYLIQNDDPELAFQIGYRTPYLDETDANHVFEHAVLASSDKYPSKNLFFNLAGGTYSTFVNAQTTLVNTTYPLASLSEEQLLKMMDAYLSCLTAPGILEEENFFKREAIRYSLYEPDGPITLSGTVLNEDTGSLTDTTWETSRGLLRALYPGKAAGNMLGRANLNYRDLTYENTMKVYELAYAFDNALIVLYGDMDFARVTAFLDEAYLAQSPARGTDLTGYFHEDVEPGFVRQELDTPAYQGSATEDASTILYGFACPDATQEQLVAAALLVNLLNRDGSPLQKRMREAGVAQAAQGTIETSAMPAIMFSLVDARPEQQEALRAAVDGALQEVSDRGFDPTFLDGALHSLSLGNKLQREANSLGIALAETIGRYWAITERADVLETDEALFRTIQEEGDAPLRAVAALLLEAPRRALVCGTPRPGLAEALDQEREDYLADMKRAMTDEEIQALIEETAAFDAWNAEETVNYNFSIPVEDLPDPQEYPEVRRETADGVTWRTVPAKAEVLKVQLYFDTDFVAEEDLPYLVLYTRLVGGLATQTMTKEETELAVARQAYGLSISSTGFADESADGLRPMLCAEFIAEPEEAAQGARLCLALLSQTRFDERDALLAQADQILLGLNLARPDDPFGWVVTGSLGGLEKPLTYTRYLKVESYRVLKAALSAAKESPEGFEALRAKLEDIREKLLRRGGVDVVICGEEAQAQALREALAPELAALRERETPAHDYSLIRESARRWGGITEAADQSVAMSVPIDGVVEGRFLPFLTAVEDRVLTPELRYAGYVYSAGTELALSLYACQYTANDVGLANTAALFEALPENIRGLSLTQEALDGYTQMSYGMQTVPMGPLTLAEMAAWIDMRGYDAQALRETIADMRNARVEDQEEAAQAFARAMEDAALVVLGTEKQLTENAELFDEVVDLRN